WALPLEGKRVTAFARTPVEGHVALGFADGSVRFGPRAAAAPLLGGPPPGLVPLGDGDASDGRAIYSPVPGGQWRRSEPIVELDPAGGAAADGRGSGARDPR